MERKYDGDELRIGNVFLEPCGLIERVYSFDIMNFLTFYRSIIEKNGVKPPLPYFNDLC